MMDLGLLGKIPLELVLRAMWAVPKDILGTLRGSPQG